MSFGYDEQIRAAPPALATRLWADDWYGLTIRLPGWRAVFCPDAGGERAGSVAINLTGGRRGGAVSSAQYAAAERLVASDVAVGEAILAALSAAAPALKTAFGGDDVVTLISGVAAQPTHPTAICIHDLGPQGVAIGVRLSCPIDEQRGLAAVLKDGVVLGLGFAGVALDTAIIRRIVEGDRSELIWSAAG